MAYYLDYSALAGKYMLMPAFAISAGQDFDFSFDYKFDNSNYGRPFGWNGSSSFLNRVLIFHSAAGNTVRITTSATNTDFTVPAYTRTDWHNFRFARASGVITCYFDGTSVGTAANNEAFTPNLMFAQASSLQQSVSCSMRNVKLSIAGALNREYLNSVGTGSTWVDIVSGQDATQQGTWPADDSEWVFYDIPVPNTHYALFNGTGYFISPTLGNLITGSPKIHINVKKFKFVNSGIRPIFWQGGTTIANREFVFRCNGGNFEVYVGGAATTVCSSAQATAAFGNANLECDLFGFELDGTTVRLYKDGSVVRTATITRGTGRLDGALFFVGAQQNNDTTGSGASTAIVTSGSQVGDTEILINDVLVRNYIMPSSGTTVDDSVGGNTLTQGGTWPADDSEWVFYSTGGTPWEGTVGKTTLSTTTKALLLSLGYSSTVTKQSLTITPRTDTISAGYINVLNKNSETVNYKQLAVSAGTSIPFITTLNKTSYALSSKQLDISAGYLALLNKQTLNVTNRPLDALTGSNIPFSGVIGKSSYILDGKQLSVALGFNSGGNKQSLSVSSYQQQISTGFIDNIQELTLTLDGKPFSVTTGTEISFVGVLNKSSLNTSGKPLNVSAGTVIPFNGLVQKTSLTLTGKQLSTIRGQILEIQKDALEIVQKQLSVGETIYPIIPIERLFTLRDGDRTYVLKQKTTIYLIKNK